MFCETISHKTLFFDVLQGSEYASVFANKKSIKKSISARVQALDLTNQDLIGNKDLS